MTSGHKFRSAALALVLLALAGGAWAQESESKTSTNGVESTKDLETPKSTSPDDFDSRTTRAELREILSRHPEDVGVMLRLDPSLFTNEEWIASYPAIADFVSRHPEVPLNAAYYLESVRVPGSWDPEPSGVRMARQTMEAITIFLVMTVVTAGLVWLIRTLLEHRRWSRVSRVQTDIYNKLLDRFTSHEDLLQYVQSTAGKEFIQSAIMPINTGSAAPVAAPVSRILWSLQAGIILVTIGFGLQFVSGQVHPDAASSFSSLGILALCAGVGFAASAVVAWIVSRKLGILPGGGSEAETGSPRERTLAE